MDQEQVKRLGSLSIQQRKRYWSWNDGRIQCCASYERKIDIISEKGTGTTFLLTFPLIQKRDEILITFFCSFN